MASIAQRLRDAFLKPAQNQAKKRLQGLEQRSAKPGKGEKVVVRPDRPTKPIPKKGKPKIRNLPLRK